MNIIEVATVSQWRAWLERNHASSVEVWLVIGHKNSSVRSPSYAEAIEQALCFGWIDGLHRSRDEHSSQLRFSPRRVRSGWSALNRERATRMIATGQMTPAGMDLVTRAKAEGTWEIDTRVPPDLDAALDADPLARSNFEKLSPSSRRLILESVSTAKRPETRRRRIAEAVARAAANQR